MALVAALASTTIVATAGPANAAGPPALDPVSVSTVAVQAPGTVVLSYTATMDSPVSQAGGDRVADIVAVTLGWAPYLWGPRP
jgi:hypothetical protein